MSEQGYVSSSMTLVAGVPQRVAQDATSFSILAADNISAISVSLDQGGFGALPPGISLEMPRLSPLYVLSSINQTVTIAYANGGVKLKDNRTGKIDANGNLLIQTGRSPVGTFSISNRVAMGGGPAQKLIVGIYGATVKSCRITDFQVTYDNLGSGLANPLLTLARFTGSPAASGSIVAMESGDASQYVSSVDQSAGYVRSDILGRWNACGAYQAAMSYLQGKMPMAQPGQGIGLFCDGSGFTVTASLRWMEE